MAALHVLSSEATAARVENLSIVGDAVHGLVTTGVVRSSSALRGENGGTGGLGYGVFGSHGGAGAGVYGTTLRGRGVYGLASARNGVNYGVYGRSDSSSGFDFYAAGAGVNYGSSSSRRWKSDVQPIDAPLDKIAQLRGVYFDWDEEHGGHHDVGMIAEEVGKILPEIVSYEENRIDAIGMDYSKMTPLLVEAINALRAEKDAEIAKLIKRLDRMDAMLKKLTTAVEK